MCVCVLYLFDLKISKEFMLNYMLQVIYPKILSSGNFILTKNNLKYECRPPKFYSDKSMVSSFINVYINFSIAL